MKLTINKTITEELEVELPVYRIGIAHAYKVFSDDYCLQVYTSSSSPTIGIYHSRLAFIGVTEIDCTKEEFDKAYKKALKLINSKR